jgi:hypothetical protein
MWGLGIILMALASGSLLAICGAEFAAQSVVPGDSFVPLWAWLVALGTWFQGLIFIVIGIQKAKN